MTDGHHDQRFGDFVSCELMFTVVSLTKVRFYTYTRPSVTTVEQTTSILLPSRTYVSRRTLVLTEDLCRDMATNDGIHPDLSKLTPKEQEEALKAAMAAKRAEQRALDRSQARKREERRMELHRQQLDDASNEKSNGAGSVKVKFVSKKEREELAKKREMTVCQRKSGGLNGIKRNGVDSTSDHNSKRSSTSKASQPHLNQSHINAMKRNYVQDNEADNDKHSLERKERERKKKQKKIVFKFEWDKEDDTLGNDINDILYNGAATVATRIASSSSLNGKIGNRDVLLTMKDVWSKRLDEMSERDWRIIRENYDIRVKGGKAPPPMRSFRESPSGVPTVHPALLDAIKNILRYEEPSPIQRQAIPIGLQRRDLIGIAETGSGKTAAFSIPLCHLILSLPRQATSNVAVDGPLALVMAPTRELALQIDVEISRLLSRQRDIKTLAVVGGQPIQVQASKLREGIHIVVGTPGRINDCVEMAYLVLNQCSYIVLDEADRMIDLGFAPQIDQILDSMGCLLKSENEQEAYEQEQEDARALQSAVPKRRLTAMFSATMPPEVERIAKKYLRYPAIVTIGDEDSVRNTRIEQRIIFLSSPAQKERALQDILRKSHYNDKIIVFVNEKKHADGVGRMVERAGKRCVVLHGGKSQEQREENLQAFKRGGVTLVATDVAGRGLDVPNVTHVINFDLPTRSIENYCHRIGRTGRAGSEGFATSLMTDEDEGMMAQLKQYLESTNMPIPDKLARHPSAQRGGIMGGTIIH